MTATTGAHRCPQVPARSTRGQLLAAYWARNRREQTPFEGVDQPGAGDGRRVAHEQVHVIGSAVELGQLGTQVGAHLPDGVLAVGEHRVVEHATPIPRDKHQTGLPVGHDGSASTDVGIWLPAR